MTLACLRGTEAKYLFAYLAGNLESILFSILRNGAFLTCSLPVKTLNSILGSNVGQVFFRIDTIRNRVQNCKINAFNWRSSSDPFDCYPNSLPFLAHIHGSPAMFAIRILI